MMDLKSGYPFWALRNGLMRPWPRLNASLDCGVAVVGGGISGALIADELARHGHDVVVLEQREIGWGSTSASTAMLQYEIDTPLTELVRRYGRDDAVAAYLACADAVGKLAAIADGLPDAGHLPQRSLYLATWRRDVAALHEECRLRAQIGLPVHWLEPARIEAEFGARAHGGILSDLAGGVDPYRLAYRLFDRAEEHGARIHDRSRVEAIDVGRRRVVLSVEGGHTVRAGYVVMAAGYAGQKWLERKVAQNRSSYAFVTDPMPEAELGALQDTMLWETARPYRYLRATSDHRLVVGGEDDAVDLPTRRDRRVDSKARLLVRRIQRLIPRLQLQPTFCWAGTFAETADGLPWFGAHPQHGPRMLFAMAYGGNGITYSQIGAELLRATVEGRPHPLTDFFGFGRAAK